MKNNIYRLLLSVLIISVFVSCRNTTDKKKLGNFKTISCDSLSSQLTNYDSRVLTLLDEEGNPVGDTVIKIKKNLTIYIPCREYIYRSKFYSKEGDLLAIGKILLMPLGKKWPYDQSQDAILIKHKFLPEQKKAVKTYFRENNYPVMHWQKETKTGIQENVTTVWTHPFRSNQYVLTEVAPFPSVRLPLKVGNDWVSHLSIGEGWGPWENTTGYSQYEVVSKEEVFLKGLNTSLSCFKIKASEKFDFGTSYLTYYFSHKYGFVKESYQFYNGEKLTIELIDIR